MSLSIPPKYSKGTELTVWFKFSDGHSEPLAIGNVLSVRVVSGKYLYTLENVQTSPDGLCCAYEYECTMTLEQDRLEVIEMPKPPKS